MSAVIAALSILAGVLVMLIAGVGVLRMPDTLTRASAATKATGLGAGLILLGVGIAIGTPNAIVKVALAIALQVAGAPLAGHLIGRAAYRSGAPLWEGTVIDDYRRFYPYERQRMAWHRDAGQADPSGRGHGPP